MQAEQQSALLPCPFCGGKAQCVRTKLDERFAYADEVRYSCVPCGCGISARGDTSKPGYADNSTVGARALARWNRRAAISHPSTPQGWQPIDPDGEKP